MHVGKNIIAQRQQVLKFRTREKLMKLPPNIKTRSRVPRKLRKRSHTRVAARWHTTTILHTWVLIIWPICTPAAVFVDTELPGRMVALEGNILRATILLGAMLLRYWARFIVFWVLTTFCTMPCLVQNCSWLGPVSEASEY